MFFCGKLAGKLILSTELKTISNYAFGACGFTGDLDLKNVESIGTQAFLSCSELTSVIIPASITDAANIGNIIFQGCSKLKMITIDSASVAEALTTKASCGSMLDNATTIRIKNGLTVGSYVTSNFNKSAAVDSENYWVYTKK